MGRPARDDRIVLYKRLIELRAADRGIPLQQFCRRHGISVWTYYYWRKRLSTGAVPVSRPFVRVHVGCAGVPGAGFELLFPNGIILRTAASLDRRTMTEIATTGVE
jgi:hypothetical protein